MSDISIYNTENFSWATISKAEMKRKNILHVVNFFKEIGNFFSQTINQDPSQENCPMNSPAWCAGLWSGYVGAHFIGRVMSVCQVPYIWMVSANFSFNHILPAFHGIVCLQNLFSEALSSLIPPSVSSSRFTIQTRISLTS